MLFGRPCVMSQTSLSPKTQAELVDSAQSDVAMGRRTRILLVEGDGFTRLVLLLRLRLAGFRVDFTSNGILGLRKLRSCQPDVLLLGLKLCGMSGLELIKAARAETSFGLRPIYVFTHVSKLGRTTRKELAPLDINLIDKSAVSREDLVKIFANTYLSHETSGDETLEQGRPELPEEPLGEMVMPEAIEEIIGGVREESEELAGCKEPEERAASGRELLSRVSSLTSCAEAAELPKLARHAKALEQFLTQLSKRKLGYTDAVLSTVKRAIDVMSHMSFIKDVKKQTLTGFTAVIVDEAPASKRALEEALVKAGFEPVAFEDPGRAREHLVSHRTGLIVANVLLPEAHGLGLKDIRQLPLHVQTPVIFGPEPTVLAILGGELPTNAPRLDTEPLLLTELAVRALNEVQASEAPPVADLAPSLPTAGAGRSLSNAAAGLAFEDGFELFAPAPRQEQATVSSRSEPLLRAEPGATDVEHEAELPVPLPVTPIDATQTDERPLEAVPLSGAPLEMSPWSQPEGLEQDQSASATWLESGNNPGHREQELSAESGVEPNQETAAVELAAAIGSNEEIVMNHQLEAAPVEYAPAGEVSQPTETTTDQGNSRDALATRVCEAEMALYHARAKIERQEQEIQALREQIAAEVEAQKREDAGEGAAKEPGEVEQQLRARCAELEQELGSLRQAFEAFNGNFDQQQQGAAEADKHVQELKQRLREQETALARQREDQQGSEARLREELEAAHAARQSTEDACQQSEARCAELEQQLGGLRQAKEELANQLVELQKASAEADALAKERPASAPLGEPGSGAPADELEQRVRQGVAALARATADLAKERGERRRSDRRAAELSARLQALHQDFGRAMEAQRDHLARISALEEEQRQISQALEGRAADVEQQKAERLLAEEQLQKAKEVNAQLRKDTSFFEEASKRFDGARQELQARLEDSLAAARESEARLQQESTERQKLAQGLEVAQRELHDQSRGHENLEQELQTAREALQEREAKLQLETAERQRLQQTLESLKRNARAGSEHDLEFSKLEAALHLEQVERQRQEAQLARLRHSAVDAAHAARALRTSLRRQIREPVDDLVNSARRLLELEMGEQQKSLAETVLQDVLLVQTRLREPDAPQPEPAESPASATT